ncbi:MAG: bifunctional oligoribonuclease/PAP phosphatase NrnA [Clostridia bacterium]|nr:bifunctional oligoribonuclease/PAP phosphatase NrnA [Clostridia bacterium]
MKITDAADFIKSCDNAFILTHRSPDGDTLGSAFALCRIMRALGKKAQVLYDGQLYDKFEYLKENLPDLEFEPRCIIAVDIADSKLIPAQYQNYSESVDLCLDHHGSNTGYAKRTYVDEKSAAAGEIIYELAELLGIIDSDIAKALYTAIATDTGCFKFSNTTPKTHRIAAKLMEYDFDFSAVNRAMFESFTRERIKLEQLLLSSLEYFADGRGVCMLISKEMMELSGASDDDIEGLAAIPRSIKGVYVGITMREKDDGYKLSVRTNPLVNACSICAEVGGGGHPAAAGGFISGSLKHAKETIIAISEKYISQVN